MEIDNIIYQYWILKPRTNLETLIKPTESVEDFCSELKNLLRHSFFPKEQVNFLTTLKESLKYTFVVKKYGIWFCLSLIISDCLKIDTVAVHDFIKIIADFAKIILDGLLSNSKF